MKTINHGRRLLALLLAVLTMLTAALPVLAESASAQGSPYRIVLVAPGGWSGNHDAAVKVSITDRDRIGWFRIEYRMNDGAWVDCEDQFDQNKAEITVHENGTFTLRITDPQGQTWSETAEISSIDLAAPVVTAAITGTTLRIEVTDEMSGIAGVQVNSMLFTAVTENRLDVELDENLNRFEKLAVRAFDYAGNFSEPVTLDNPNYVEPTPEPTAEPTAAPAATRKPTATTAPTAVPGVTPSATAAAAVTATETPRQGLGGSLIYVPDEDWPPVTAVPTAQPTAVPTPVPTPAPTPEPIVQTEYIVIGPGMPFQSDGNAHTLDMLYSAATNKQFITLQSKSGNTFYLVIDYDKPIDEDAEMYETYFLNLVDERDLLALMSDEEKEALPTPTPEIVYVTPEPTSAPQRETPATEEPQTDKPNQMTAIVALVGILAAVGIGAFVLKKNKGKAPAGRTDSDLDLEDDDEDDESDAPEESEDKGE